MGRFFIPSRKINCILGFLSFLSRKHLNSPCTESLRGRQYVRDMKTVLESTADPPWTVGQLRDVLWSRQALYY